MCVYTVYVSFSLVVYQLVPSMFDYFTKRFARECVVCSVYVVGVYMQRDDCMYVCMYVCMYRDADN
jgi:hypothetical protein